MVEIRKDEIALDRVPAVPWIGCAACGQGTYGDPVAYIRALRDEWED